jgi:hypothetical protein
VRLPDQQYVFNANLAKEIVNERPNERGLSGAWWPLKNANGSLLNQLLKGLDLPLIEACLFVIV